MSEYSHIHWFRQDLRTSDNPSLVHAAKQGKVLPIYILDDENAGEHKMGAASRVWLYHSLKSLNESLDGNLQLYKGNATEIISNLIENHNIAGMYWNRCYEPWRIKRDEEIKEYLKQNEIDCQSFNGSLLWEPWIPLKDDGDPYRVFTPFYKKGCLNADAPREPLNAPRNLECVATKFESLTLDDLDLLPSRPWGDEIIEGWSIGEEGAKRQMRKFMGEGLDGYKEGRNHPAQFNVSRLSPHLHWGELSPNQVWYEAEKKESGKDKDHFHSELGWREFSNSLLYHFPNLPRENLQAKFDDFPWGEDDEKLKKWQKGQTGYPIVDAGMRELYATGYMHNRLRMIVGSFLVKNLLLHWHHGEKWFWDCLFDADLANNSASWQWVAGSGADAAPYFRIFNPITQGEKFDKHGEYTRKYVPELKDMPDKYLFRPWEAPEDVLKEAGVELGKTYPKPMVDVKESRERALAAFETTKKDAA